MPRINSDCFYCGNKIQFAGQDQIAVLPTWALEYCSQSCYDKDSAEIAEGNGLVANAELSDINRIKLNVAMKSAPTAQAPTNINTIAPLARFSTGAKRENPID